MIGSFFASHKNKFIIVTIDADYYSDNQLDAMKQRMNIVKDDLVAAGV